MFAYGEDTDVMEYAERASTLSTTLGTLRATMFTMYLNVCTVVSRTQLCIYICI